MKMFSIIPVIFLVILLVLMPLLAACGDDDETAEPTKTVEPTMTEPTAPMTEPTAPMTEPTAPMTEPTEKLKLTLGWLTDMTGPASQALAVVDQSIEDAIRYFNEKKPIPGVELDIIKYDTSYDPSKYLTGYEFLKGKGADFYGSPMSSVAAVVKPDVEDDGSLLFCQAGADEVIYPLGRSFVTDLTTGPMILTLLKWIAENDWDYATKGPAKLGGMDWEGPYGEEVMGAMEDYAKAHPDQFEWVDGFLVPLGTPTWGPESQVLFECDYVFPAHTGSSIPSSINEMRRAGFTGKFLFLAGHVAFKNFVVEAVGWDNLDGTLLALPMRYWTEDSELPNLAKQILVEFHNEGTRDAMMGMGVAYIGSFSSMYGVFEILMNYVERVGAQNFTLDGFYEECIDTRMPFSDGNEWQWTETKRTAFNKLGIYEIQAAGEDIFRKDAEYQTLITTP